MIPREAPAGAAEATAATEATTTTTMDDCPNATTATVIDIPIAAAAHANANAADELASKRLAAVPDAAVVLSVCRHLGGACTHPAHLYAPQPALSLVAVTGGSGCGQLSNLRHTAAATTTSEKKYLADYRRCCPPPLFIILISLLEIGVFVYDYLTVKTQSELNSTTIPSESSLIYRPDRRLQIWRFVSYMVLHANWFHLGFNVVVQLLYGLPLEMVHGSLRIAVVYLAGVFAGSLGTSVVDSEVYLVGASGGVYALLAAQLANILLNYGQMRYAVSQLVSVAIFVCCDLGYALYTKYAAVESKVAPSVSYIAHVTGSLAGLTMGLLVLRNFDSRRAHSHLVWWLALGVYAAFTIFAIVFNLINTVTAQMLEQEGEVIKQHLLHDLGIS